MNKGTQSQHTGNSIRIEFANMGSCEMPALRASETIFASIKRTNTFVEDVAVLESANTAAFANNVCLAKAKVSASISANEACANCVPGPVYACTGDSATSA